METLATAELSGTSSDEALIRRARLGDATAFDALAATRIDRCYRLAWSILSNDADAADATQDAFVAAWRQLPRLRDAAAFDGWLNRIVANAARMALRHRRRLREIQVRPGWVGDDSGITDERPFDPNARTGIDDLHANDVIVRAFARLRNQDRAILVLHHVDERPVAEIARTLGIPVGTAKWRLHAARRALEQAMEAEA